MGRLSGGALGAGLVVVVVGARESGAAAQEHNQPAGVAESAVVSRGADPRSLAQDYVVSPKSEFVAQGTLSFVTAAGGLAPPGPDDDVAFTDVVLFGVNGRTTVK